MRDVFARMLEDGSWGRYHGPHCEALIAALCEYHGVEHAILCSSGTCAIELALRAIPVSAGDEVILAAYDFKANFINVLTTGCVPVLIDTIADYPISDLNQLEARSQIARERSSFRIFTAIWCRCGKSAALRQSEESP